MRSVGAAAALLLAAVLALSSNAFTDWPPTSDTAGAAQPDRISGDARVLDGDTLTIAGERIRLWGVDAPERGQTCDRGAPGRSAAAALSRAVGSAEVTCRIRDWDDYGRAVARCEAGGDDLGAAMVRAGWAWDYRQYSGGRYREAEAAARDAGSGVWALGCAPAWEWRRRQRA